MYYNYIAPREVYRHELRYILCAQLFSFTEVCIRNGGLGAIRLLSVLYLYYITITVVYSKPICVRKTAFDYFQISNRVSIKSRLIRGRTIVTLLVISALHH